MGATIAPAPKRHQKFPLITLAAAALRADLAPRHYRIAPPGDMLRKTTSAASGRRPVVTGRLLHSAHHPEAHTACPTNTTTARIVASLARVASMSGRPGFAARRTLRPFSTAILRTSVALPGPCVRNATCARGSPARQDRRTRSRPPPRAAPARRGPLPHPVAGQRQHRLGGAGGDRGRDDAIVASVQPAEVRCAAAMSTNQLRTSFAPMTSTQRAPWPPPAGLRHTNR